MQFLVQLRTGNQANQVFSLAAASLSSSQCDEAKNKRCGAELESGGVGDSLLALAAIIWSLKNCIHNPAVVINNGVNSSDNAGSEGKGKALCHSKQVVAFTSHPQQFHCDAELKFTLWGKKHSLETNIREKYTMEIYDKK